MKVIILKNHNIEEDKQTIIDNIRTECIFVVDTDIKLYQYIEQLELNDKNKQRLKICSEIKNLDVEFRNEYKNEKINLLSELLEMIDISMPCHIVVMGDNTTDEEKQRKVHIQLSNIIQQFMYINLPLDIVQVMTEKEAYDIEKIKKFEKNLDEHERTLLETLDSIDKYRHDIEGNYKQKIIDSLNKIKKYIQEAKDNELKIAVTASKKSGKSVIVNSIIGYELAPTSLELATPNNCIYRVSKDNKYTLKYGAESHIYKNPEDMKKYIRNCFKKAEESPEQGYAIPDMEIGYVDNKNDFTSYTVYDTPGPDLAGAYGHKTAAQKAINETDVIVFPIDYSKFLTDDEVKHLKYIKEICNDKKKRYSLIMAVNKLDMRYNSSEKDKSVVRILDFIKHKLMAVDPVFSDSMVIGTSALTYFNCLVAPSLKYCEKLSSDENFEDTLQDCIDRYYDSDNEENEMDILNQIDQTVTNAKRFHNQKLESLEDIKNFSGMPNLLNYIKYIATNKARNEKINTLIFKIDSEYKNIQNLFHFKELEEKMMNDSEKLETAKKILQNFIDSVNKIFDKDYEDIYFYKKSGEKLESNILNELAKKRPVEISDIVKQFNEKIDSNINLDKFIKEYAKNNIPAQINQKLSEKYYLSKEYRKDYTNNGKEVKAVPIQEIFEIFNSIINDNTINEKIAENLNLKIRDLTLLYDKECEKIKYDLVGTANRRQQKLKIAMEECKNQLGEQCDLPFDLKVPSFRYDLKIPEKIHKFNEKIHLEENLNLLLNSNKEDNLMYKQNINALNKQEGFFPALSKAFQHLFHRKEEYISEDSAKKIYTDMNIGNSVIIGGVIGSEEMNKAFDETKYKLKANAEEFTDIIEKEMKNNMDNSKNLAVETKRILDRTEEYKNNIDRLNKEKVILQELKEIVSPFSELWDY